MNVIGPSYRPQPSYPQHYPPSRPYGQPEYERPEYERPSYHPPGTSVKLKKIKDLQCDQIIKNLLSEFEFDYLALRAVKKIANFLKNIRRKK